MPPLLQRPENWSLYPSSHLKFNDPRAAKVARRATPERFPPTQSALASWHDPSRSCSLPGSLAAKIIFIRTPFLPTPSPPSTPAGSSSARRTWKTSPRSTATTARPLPAHRLSGSVPMSEPPASPSPTRIRLLPLRHPNRPFSRPPVIKLMRYLPHHAASESSSLTMVRETGGGVQVNLQTDPCTLETAPPARPRRQRLSSRR